MHDLSATATAHVASNQVAPLCGYNVYLRDLPLREAVQREGAGASGAWLTARGKELGSQEMQTLADQANRFPPVAKLFDANGNRRDVVEFHPAYHTLMTWLKQHGAAAGPWANPAPGAHVRRAALYVMYAQVEDGTLCPTTMTHASVPALALDPPLAATWIPRICTPDYDARFLPARDKRGVTIGMGMTEKQGGSDVRANVTAAHPLGGRGYAITGHKWFFSAPMCDAFLILAQAPGGLSCFLLPRFHEDGGVNEIRIVRLKDKLGDRSNASSEVEFAGAHATLVGEEGRGIATILEMGMYCRLDCALGTAGLIRGALTQALHHARHRAAFGKPLIDAPLMRNVLADLALESEAATALALRLARSFDAREDESESALRRVLTPAAKFWICKRGPAVSVEAMEVLGGNGFVEDGPLARNYRQMPLNSIWEGSGNVMCLDVLRAIERNPASVVALGAELAAARGGNTHLDAYADALVQDIAAHKVGQADARALTQRIALAVQAALLVRFAPHCIADAFCASRLGPQVAGGRVFGALDGGADFQDILERAWPA